ncbi:mitochondrial ribosomal death-associated protein 3-domain-containing protein [Tribonema minus]|uniref:Small ribosomal subunit protein mS29 n=1 Tax=Tribonema minus TaxID=303371 RepID=A0A836C8P4_9STRA|nr:mitochondrial ribosomal death-associated protein 3-domain-containing protein [Tribonema minus]
MRHIVAIAGRRARARGAHTWIDHICSLQSLTIQPVAHALRQTACLSSLGGGGGRRPRFGGIGGQYGAGGSRAGRPGYDSTSRTPGDPDRVMDFMDDDFADIDDLDYGLVPDGAVAVPGGEESFFSGLKSKSARSRENRMQEMSGGVGRAEDAVGAAATNQAPAVQYVTSSDPDDVPRKQPTYFIIPDADLKARFPEGVAGYLRHEFDYAALRDRRAIMHRAPARRIIGHMKRAAAGDPSAQRAFLLRGARGTGKSAALNHAVHYARANGWVVLFVPEARKLLRTGIYCQPSARVAGMYDTPLHAQRMIAQLLAAHGPQLQELEVQDATRRARYAAFAGSSGRLSVADMAKPGLPAGKGVDDEVFEAAENAADGCFADIVEELLSTEAVPVLLAVDEYSELFQPSAWHYRRDVDHLAAFDIDDEDYEDKVREARLHVQLERIPGEKLTVVAPFMPFRPPPDGGLCDPAPFTPRRGAVIAAETLHYPPVRKIKGKSVRWPYFDDFVGTSADPWTVETAPYSAEEFAAALGHYAACDMYDERALGDADVARVRIKTMLNPKLIFHKFSFKPYG